MVQLVLLRHGQSVWNLENRFTGWTDVDLTPQGIEEAREAARLLVEGGFTFDEAHTSVLKRAVRTLWLVMDVMDLMWIPVHRSWRLNERHYGALQGLNKADMTAKYGDEQVLAWRRSYATRPPALDRSDPGHPARDRRYAEVPPSELPSGESLQDTVARFLPYWHGVIEPQVRAGKQVLIAAHGNSLRALVKFLDGMTDDEVVELNIPTGIPLVYQLDGDLRPTDRRYLGDPEAARRAADAVARQSVRGTRTS